jgi:hypothetical protein
MMKLEVLLADLDSRIGEDQEKQLLDGSRCFCDGGWREDVFQPGRPNPRPPQVAWPAVLINEALQDDEMMLVREFASCSRMLETGSGMMMCVRSNYGVGILPSVFGAEPFFMRLKQDVLPNCRHLPNGKEDVKRLLHAGIPDLNRGWGEKVFRIAERLMEIKSRYPLIARYVHIDHPDCQSPVDVCELLWGSGLFLDFHDEPELVHDFLKLITATYKAFLDRWYSLVPREAYHMTWGLMHKGAIMLRDDSAMNLSPDMYREFIYHYHQELLRYFGGGAIHSCGRVEHFLPLASELEGLHGINISQPHLNDMEVVFRHTVDKGIPLLALQEAAVRQAQAAGRPLRGMVSVL